MTQNEIKAEVKALLDNVGGLGFVDTRMGGVATWAKNGRPAQSYFTVHVAAIEEADATLGHRAFAEHTVEIEGWMPFAYADDTDAAWGDLVDTLREALRFDSSEDEGLGGTINLVGLPQVITNDYEAVTSGGNTGDIVCHHVLIQWAVTDYIDYAER